MGATGTALSSPAETETQHGVGARGGEGERARARDEGPSSGCEAPSLPPLTMPEGGGSPSAGSRDDIEPDPDRLLDLLGTLEDATFVLLLLDADTDNLAVCEALHAALPREKRPTTIVRLVGSGNEGRFLKLSPQPVCVISSLMPLLPELISQLLAPTPEWSGTMINLLAQRERELLARSDTGDENACNDIAGPGDGAAQDPPGYATPQRSTFAASDGATGLRSRQRSRSYGSRAEICHGSDGLTEPDLVGTSVVSARSLLAPSVLRSPHPSFSSSYSPVVVAREIFPLSHGAGGAATEADAPSSVPSATASHERDLSVSRV